MSLFFVAMGMSIDIGALAEQPLLFAQHVLVILALKILVLFGLALAFGHDRRIATRIAFDTNAAHVADRQGDGRPVYCGDVSDPDLLAAIDLGKVETVVLTSNNSASVLRAVSMIRTGHPKATIIARARDLAACSALTEAGANLAPPEALEASLRLGAEMLKSLGLRSRSVDTVLGNAREEDYALVRKDESGAG